MAGSWRSSLSLPLILSDEALAFTCGKIFNFFFRVSLRARRDEGAGERRPWDVRRVRMIGERLKVNSGRKPHRAASLAERQSASW